VREREYEKGSPGAREGKSKTESKWFSICEQIWIGMERRTVGAEGKA